jgi:hypothetical protein
MGVEDLKLRFRRTVWINFGQFFVAHVSVRSTHFLLPLVGGAR